MQLNVSNQRVRRGSLGAMMHALNTSVDDGNTEEFDLLVEGGMRAVRNLKMVENMKNELTGDELAAAVIEANKELEGDARYSGVSELVNETKLGEHCRSLLNSLLHLISVVEALCEKEVSTITKFGPQGKVKKVSRKDLDEVTLKAAFEDFCPGHDWNDCRVSVFVAAIMKFFAGNANDIDEMRKHRAIAAMGVIFDKRLVLDDELWDHVDALSLGGSDSSEQKFFTVRGQSANRRRYSALHYMLTLCLGDQIGQAIKATDDNSEEFEWIRSASSDLSFQKIFLLCSVDKIRKYVTDRGSVKAHLFGIGRNQGDVVALETGRITVDDVITSAKALLQFAKGRIGKIDVGRASSKTFCDGKTILFDLDSIVVDELLGGVVELIERIYMR